ncbi:pyridoxamine 5'-phosphate oxidase family protein [Salarchaeum japonicum]|uniref:Pyridoxamine 5'-phosphate oxidase family protein n=1 Tax=Salarchaeum japonicum TaxID=555573 RepID=A0AAV3T1Y4_9EURY|nr:pyridoxamine 5'-phosphate oxidase family protein [Salarchaeum japonicum]
MDRRPALQLSDDEVDAFLRENGVGVLSLADDGDAYGLPISYGYDGDDRIICLQFADAPWSRKRDFVETTRTASFTVFELTETLEATSVVAQGPLSSVADEEAPQALDALADNAVFTALDESGVPIEDAVLRLFWLEPETLTGRHFDPFATE